MDTKVSDSVMQETVVESKVVVHYVGDVLKRKKIVEEQIASLTAVLADFDILIQRLIDVGCKIEEEVIEDVKP